MVTIKGKFIIQSRQIDLFAIQILREIYFAQCGNYGHLPPLQEIFVKKHFDGIFAKKSWGKIFEITTLCFVKS